MTLSYPTCQSVLFINVSHRQRREVATFSWGAGRGGGGGGAGVRPPGMAIKERRAGKIEKEGVGVANCLPHLPRPPRHPPPPTPSTLLCLRVQESKASTRRGRGIPPHPAAGSAPTTLRERCGDSSRLHALSINTP